MVVKVRRLARQLALDVLYEAEIRGSLPVAALATREKEGWVIASAPEDTPDAQPEDPGPQALAYVRTIVEGVQTHQADIDELIAGYADRWAIERMPVIDRNLIRMALFELYWTEVPVPVAINEAVELAKSLSTDDSGRFVNGVLGKIVETHPVER